MAFLVQYGKWFLKQSWPYAETVSNDDAAFVAGLAVNKSDVAALAVLAAFVGHPLVNNQDPDEVFNAVNAVVQEHPGRRIRREQAEAARGTQKDMRVFLFERLHADQIVLKDMLAAPIARRQALLDKEQQLRDRLDRAAQGDEARLSDAAIGRLQSQQMTVLNLLAAFNRDEETALHQSLVDDGTIAGRYIKSTASFCSEQHDRLVRGVCVMPWGKGKVISFWQYLLLICSAIGILIINGTTEYFTFTAKEYVGVGRNGVGRPRSLYQLFMVLFIFTRSDGWSLWELGRQRSLGAMLSWVAYFYAHFHPEIYDALAFVVGVAVGAVIFQILVQLGDLVVISIQLLRIGKEARPGLSWFRFLWLCFRNRLPNWRWLPRWLNFHKALPQPIAAAANRVLYEQLKVLNARNAAWAKGFKKSKSMSITWMIYARNRAMPRNIYAVLGGVVVALVFSADYIRKQTLMVFTLLVWGFSDYATWGKWQTFTIITAFFAATSVKLQDLAFSPEQEVQASYNVFCNMVGGNIPTLCGVLALAAAHPEWFLTPDILKWNMPVIFIICLWTDLLSQWLMDLPSWPGAIRRWLKERL